MNNKNIKIHGFKVGYMCPHCQHIRPKENIENYIISFNKNNKYESDIKCPTCGGTEKFIGWQMVTYPCTENNKTELKYLETIKWIKSQYDTDFTEEELQQLNPRDEVIYENVKEILQKSNMMEENKW
jgi:hypothetical protein